MARRLFGRGTGGYAASRRQAAREAIADMQNRLDFLERIEEIWRTMMWIEHDDVSEDALLSVIMPTHNRAQLVARAIRSVCAQTYPKWELLVVNDGSTDGTRELLDSMTDPRIRVIHTEQSGVAAARNRGLIEATGSLVAYLDDDNVMHPAWLRSVVWAFVRWPDVKIVYGAEIGENLHPYSDAPHQMPVLVFRPFDRERMAQDTTFPDINVLAHRAGVPDARFDEELSGCADADFGLRVTMHTPMLPLPAIAALYTTSVAERLTGGSRFWEEMRIVRDRASRSIQQP